MAKVSINFGYIIGGVAAILLLLCGVIVQHAENNMKVVELQSQLDDYEQMIVFLDEAYDSLLVQELELEKIYDEKIITIDTMSIDSLRSIFSERYGFINMLHSNTATNDSSGLGEGDTL